MHHVHGSSIDITRTSSRLVRECTGISEPMDRNNTQAQGEHSDRDVDIRPGPCTLCGGSDVDSSSLSETLTSRSRPPMSDLEARLLKAVIQHWISTRASKSTAHVHVSNTSSGAFTGAGSASTADKQLLCACASACMRRCRVDPKDAVRK